MAHIGHNDGGHGGEHMGGQNGGKNGGQNGAIDGQQPGRRNGYQHSGHNGQQTSGRNETQSGDFRDSLSGAFSGAFYGTNQHLDLLREYAAPQNFIDDHFQFDSNINADQNSILGPAETKTMNVFFADPNAKPDDMLSGQNYTFGLDGKMGDNGNAMATSFDLLPLVGAVDPVSTMAGAQTTRHVTHLNTQPFQFPSHGLSEWTPAHDRRTSNEVRASDALNQLSQSTGPAAGAWGNMSLGPQILPMHDSSESPASSGRNSAGDMWSPQQYNHSGVRYSGHGHMSQSHVDHYQRHMHSRGQHQAHGGNAGAALPQNHFMPQPGQPNTQRSHVKPFMRFGSDPHISSNGYRGPDYAPLQDKASNLMSVPLAEQVATNGHVKHPNSRTYHQQNPSHASRAYQNMIPSPGHQYGGLPNTHSRVMVSNSQRHSQQEQIHSQRARNMHGTHERDADYENGQLRKRRRSQVQREDEAEYQPERHKQNAVMKRGLKMPKTTGRFDDNDEPYTPVTQTSSRHRGGDDMTPAYGSRASNSPEDDDDDDGSSSVAGSGSKRKRDSKSRANLSEDQKRQNHILSEQKRRNVIKQGYADLNMLVPNLGKGKSGLSKSEILKEVVDYLESVVDGNKALMQICNLTDDDLDALDEDADAAEEDGGQELY